MTTELPILRRETADPAAFSQAVWGRVFNRRRDESRVPRAVVSASSAEHVKAAVELAGREGCRVSVRSGGHSWAVWSVRHDAVLVDLGQLKFIEYDEETASVACSPSTTSNEIVRFLSQKGRMFPTGHCGDIGIGGFLLGGGAGWNSNNWGYACEYILRFEMIDANGELLHCSSTENEDLFWLAHGGGPGFPGIITKFVLKTRKDTPIFSTKFAWPLPLVDQILPWALGVARLDDADTDATLASFYPDGSPVPFVAVLLTSFKPSQKEAEESLQTVRDSRPPGAALDVFCQPTTLLEELAFNDATAPENYRYCVDTAWYSEVADVAKIFTKVAESIPSPKSLVMLGSGTLGKEIATEWPLSVRQGHFFSMYAAWEKPEGDERMISWVRNNFKENENVEVGSLLSDCDFQPRDYKLWDEDNAKKIMELRKKRDPNGRFAGYLDAGDKSGVDGLKMRT